MQRLQLKKKKSFLYIYNKYQKSKKKKISKEITINLLDKIMKILTSVFVGTLRFILSKNGKITIVLIVIKSRKSHLSHQYYKHEIHKSSGTEWYQYSPHVQYWSQVASVNTEKLIIT